MHTLASGRTAQVSAATEPAPGPYSEDSGRPARFRPQQHLAPADLHRAAEALFDDGFRLALVAAPPVPGSESRRLVYLFTAPRPDRRIELTVRIDPENFSVPSLALLALPAGMFERELYETHGILASSSAARRATAASAPPGPLSASRVPAVRGLEERATGHRLKALVPRIERVAPDSGVAYALAYCLAVEDAYDWQVPAPVPLLRAVLLELERTQRHLQALTMACAQAELEGLSTAFGHLRKQMLTLSQEMVGHRLLRGAIVPGGVSVARLPSRPELTALGSAAAELCETALSHPDVRETYQGKWILTHRHAVMTGALGFVARASGVDIDARRDHPFHPLTAQIASVTSTTGDTLARLHVRAGEIGASFNLLGDLVPDLRPAAVSTAPLDRMTTDARRGIGLVEGPRGTVAHRLEITPDGRIAHLKMVDPTFLTRAVLVLSQRGPHDEHGSMVDPGFDLPHETEPGPRRPNPGTDTQAAAHAVLNQPAGRVRSPYFGPPLHPYGS